MTSESEWILYDGSDRQEQIDFGHPASPRFVCAKCGNDLLALGSAGYERIPPTKANMFLKIEPCSKCVEKPYGISSYIASLEKAVRPE
jgi:hypothetical protein